MDGHGIVTENSYNDEGHVTRIVREDEPVTYRIGTRGSKLAMVQATLVRDRLAAACPMDHFELVTSASKGDRITDRPLADLGGGAFVREIERALLAREIDLAVHSMKDLPAEQPEGLCLAKAWTREDPRDVLVLRNREVRSVGDPLELLPIGATVATGSVRRSTFLRLRRPDLNIVDIRGNVDTRLRKLFEPRADEPPLEAIVLAAAGLKRLGRAEVISGYLDPGWMIPAPNQGQLAIELRVGDDSLKAKIDALGDEAAETVARAERDFLKSTGATCHEAVAAYARFEDGELKIESYYEG